MKEERLQLIPQKKQRIVRNYYKETYATKFKSNLLSWIFEKMNKINKPLSRLIKKKRERTQRNTIRNERGEITTDTKEIQKIVKTTTKNYMPRNLKT